MKKPPLIRITKQFSFEAAHVLCGHDGRCRNVHGHSYLLYVTIIGSPVDDAGNPKNGMVMDFSELKKIVNELIIDTFDHSLLIKDDSPLYKEAKISNEIGNIIPLPYQPTCENLIVDFAKKIQGNLPKHLRLHSLRLYETPTSFAEWYASDNNF